MPKILLPSTPPLVYPGTDRRILRRPDLRGLLVPRTSGARLTANEIDYDDLIIHRSYRSYEPDNPGQVRYFMYELSQRNPGESHYTYFFKAVRMARVTRVPRYLRLSPGSGPNMVFEQQRDVLAALREQQVLFVNLIAKSQDSPLIFAYGAQGVGASAAEAQAQADDGWAVLSGQLDSQFQQLEYTPITLTEGENLMRYQSEWSQIAMARGRPVPAGGNFSSSNLLDSNRTEVESSLNQLESFLRGMATREFILSLVTVPLSPMEMTLAWRNLTLRLSQVRSEQQGQRTLSVGMAMPLSTGVNLGHSSGDGNTIGATAGVAHSGGVSHTLTDASGTSVTATHASATSLTDGHTLGQSTALGHNAGQNSSVTNSQAASLTNSQSATDTASSSSTLTNGSSLGVAGGVTNSASLGSSSSLTHTGGSTVGQTVAASASTGSSISSSSSATGGHGVSGGIPGVLHGSTSGSNTTGNAQGQNASNSTSVSDTGSSTSSTGTTAGQNSSLSQATSLTNSQGVSTSDAQGIGLSSASSSGSSLGESLAVANASGISSGSSLTQAASIANATTSGVSSSLSQAQGVNNSQSVAAGTSITDTTNQGVTNSYATSYGSTLGTAAGISAIPTAGMSISRQVFDESKRVLGDQLEAQMRRYLEGVEGGAFFYQMFLTAPDRETLLAGAGMLKSAFWGQAHADNRLPQAFHTITDFDPEEAVRLLRHSQAFTSYRLRESRIELIEPYRYSSYVTPAEAAAFCHPPTNENPGIMGVIDSMPVTPMPTNRRTRDLRIGWLINGERARVSDIPFSIDVDEITHTLIAGTTGIGKTTTLMTMLSEISRVTRTISEPVTMMNPTPVSRKVPAGILALDWASNLRDLASIVDPSRFSFYSVAQPKLGAFRWNPLALPDDQMDPVEWAGDTADNMTISFNLGEFGRSIIAELIADLYAANRLIPFVLRPEVRDPGTGLVQRPAITLDPVDRATLPPGAIRTNADGEEYANVLTCPALSRLISMPDLATLVLAKVEEAATIEGARIHGAAFRDRIQSLWRRVMYFAPGSMFSGIFSADPSLEERTTLSVPDLVDPEIGRVTVIEADGLDLTNRRFILGSVLLAVWRYGQFRGAGSFDHGGRGPGTFVCLEEAHELFGDQGRDEDAFSAATRTSLYESMFRRARALGMKLIAVVQNAGSIPDAVTSNTTTVMIHRQLAKADRDRAFTLLNWDHAIGQQLREYRYLGELPRGYVLIRLDARNSYLESAPVQVLTDPAPLTHVTDQDLAALAAMRV